MRTQVVGLALAFALAASGAGATTYEAFLQGVILESGGSGVDPNIQVGSHVTMTARFDDSMIAGFNPDTMTGVADVWGLPAAGYDFYKLTVGSLDYMSRSDILDGELGPLIAFSDGRITRFTTEADGYLSTPRPLVVTGLWYEDPSQILVEDSIYSRYPADFTGAWDLASSYVRAVPEPATWGLMLAGFFGLGAALRWRQRKARGALAGGQA